MKNIFGSVFMVLLFIFTLAVFSARTVNGKQDGLSAGNNSSSNLGSGQGLVRVGAAATLEIPTPTPADTLGLANFLIKSNGMGIGPHDSGKPFNVGRDCNRICSARYNKQLDSCERGAQNARDHIGFSCGLACSPLSATPLAYLICFSSCEETTEAAITLAEALCTGAANVIFLNCLSSCADNPPS